ncbi:PH domain-containing protein [Streptomyces coffeae]|uniref:PH domain-containing protein n=1 Tax=Streptomyces coffeae TaxID=621382 RepID=A0ABS1N697_9ACTN|nr:PH domain-containing protein [Streptomyces coffeae]MBL1095542.1 PH domain-containing protein [Streptomyces coffeae]
MTSPDDSAPDSGPDSARDAASDSASLSADDSQESTFADRVYRSPAGIAGGVLLLGLGAWLGIDAIIRGEGRTPWLALAGLLFAVPVVIAFTVRPAVYAGADRLLVRNPFRTITLPWASVDGVRAGYTSEVLAAGAKYQLWAIPVSLRQRKRAARQQARSAASDPYGRTSAHIAVDTDADRRAPSDAAIGDLREMAEIQASRAGAQGAPEVRWAFEVIAPTVAGAVLLVIMLAI